MNIQEEDSARYFRVQSECEQTLVLLATERVIFTWQKVFSSESVLHKALSEVPRSCKFLPIMGTLLAVLQLHPNFNSIFACD